MQNQSSPYKKPLAVVKFHGGIQASGRPRCTRVVILGCGFAGIAAAHTFAHSGMDLEVVVVDRYREQHFLPLLPDVAGETLDIRNVTCRARYLSARYNFTFCSSEIRRVDLHGRMVHTADTSLSFDYLIIAVGAQTDFSANRFISSSAWKLDDAYDAEKIRDAVMQNRYKHYVFCGGGYTGVETATHVAKLIQRQRQQASVFIVERQPGILSRLPAWERRYAAANLKRLKITVHTQTTVKNLQDAGTVVFSDGSSLEAAMLVWTAGVRPADFLQRLGRPVTADGRLIVDGNLAVTDNCFAAGDAACFTANGGCIHAGVGYAATQGAHAAANIIRILKKKRMQPYRPPISGHVIPMANGRSCGTIAGVPCMGSAATLVHYLLCAWYSRGLRTKLKLITHGISLIRRPAF